MHDNTRWGVYGNRVSSGAFVANGSGSGEKVCHATRVSNGIERSGGRTSGMGTMGGRDGTCIGVNLFGEKFNGGVGRCSDNLSEC